MVSRDICQNRQYRVWGSLPDGYDGNVRGICLLNVTGMSILNKTRTLEMERISILLGMVV